MAFKNFGKCCVPPIYALIHVDIPQHIDDEISIQAYLHHCHLVLFVPATVPTCIMTEEQDAACFIYIYIYIYVCVELHVFFMSQ